MQPTSQIEAKIELDSTQKKPESSGDSVSPNETADKKEKLEAVKSKLLLFLASKSPHKIVHSCNVEFIQILMESIKTVKFNRVNFIHLAENLPQHVLKILQEQRKRLREQGAIFTLDELSNDIEAFLQLPDAEQTVSIMNRYKFEIDFIINLWKQGKLENEAAVEQLDDEVTAPLKKLLWPNGTNFLLDGCENKELRDIAKAILKEIKQADARHWTSKNSHPDEDLEYWLSNILWQQWMHPNKENNNHSTLLDKLSPTDKEICLKHLECYRDAFIYRHIKNKNVPEPVLKLVTGRLMKLLEEVHKTKGKLDSKSDPYNESKEIIALYEFIKKQRDTLVEHYTKLVMQTDLEFEMPTNAEILEQTFKRIIMNLHLNESSMEVENGLKVLIDKIPREEILNDDSFRNEVTLLATAEFVKDFRKQLQTVPEIEVKNDKISVSLSIERGTINSNAIGALKLCFQTLIVEHAEPTVTQREEVAEQILLQWKNASHSKSLQFYLDTELLQKWNVYRDKLSNNPLQQMQRRVEELNIIVRELCPDPKALLFKHANTSTPKAQLQLKIKGVQHTR